MTRLRRRIGWWLVIMLVAFSLAGVVAGWLVVTEPSYYAMPALEGVALEAAAKRATDKLVELRNVVAEARAAAAGAPAGEADGVPQQMEVTFTQDELNAFLGKWTELGAVRESFSSLVSEPRVILREGHLILAARSTMGGMQSVVSVYVRAGLTENGRLMLSVDRIQAGRLPVARVFVGDLMERLLGAVDRRLPDWRAGAALDGAGSGNRDAILAVYGGLMSGAVAGRATSPILLIPLVDQPRGVPVMITGLRVGDGTIGISARCLGKSEQREFIEGLKAGR